MPLRADIRPAAVAEVDQHREEHVVTLERNASWSWLLVYPSGVQIWSKDTMLPIQELPSNAKALFAVDPSGTPREPGIDLQKYGVQFRPIFYHGKPESGVAIMHDTVDWEGRRDKTFNAFRTMSAVVYGRAKLPEEGSETTLGMLVSVVGGRLGAARLEDVDEVQIRQCLGVA